LRAVLRQLTGQQQQQQQQQQQHKHPTATGSTATAPAAAGDAAADANGCGVNSSSLSSCAVRHPAVAAAFLQELAAYSKAAAGGERLLKPVTLFRTRVSYSQVQAAAAAGVWVSCSAMSANLHRIWV
jgi:hypothetical protein